MKLRIYLDTSVFSAYYDDRAPERRDETKAFWARSDEFELATSELARKELEQTPDAALKTKLWDLLEAFHVHSTTAEMRALAERYIDAGVFSPVLRNDAPHVAAAVLTRQDVLLSWNFRHLVNRRRRAMVNDVNISSGLPTIEILAPPEV